MNYSSVQEITPMPFIKTTDLCKVYGSGVAQVEALRNVNLSIDKGEFIAVVGPSGSGKSTLLHMLGGIENSTSGEVIIDGQKINALNEKHRAVFRRRKIGLIFQFYNLVPALNAEENIILPLLLDGRNVDQQVLMDLIHNLDLKNRLNHLPSQLSGGQQQRVCIARALINKPAVILADEPTGNLDSKNSREVIELLMYSVKKYNQTLVLITHDLNIATKADRIIRIEDGAILQTDK